MANVGKIVGLSVSSAFGYWAGYNYGGTPLRVKSGQTVEARDDALADTGAINTFKLISGVSSVAYALLGVTNPQAQASIVALGSYLIGETFQSYRKQAKVQTLPTAGEIVQIDWQKTFEKRKAECDQGDQSACERMELARARLRGEPVPPKSKELDCSTKECPRGQIAKALPKFRNHNSPLECRCVPHTPQASIGGSRAIAVTNAKAACNAGQNGACCWLKNTQNIEPPKPCVSENVAGFGNYFGGF